MSQDLLSHLSAQDQALFWKFGLGAKASVPFQCVHHAFEANAASHPNLTAVQDGSLILTYRALNLKANCLAARLRSAGVNIGSRVCLLVERSLYLPIGYMGILKAGGAYIPLDGNVVSDSTLKHAVKDSNPVVILTLRKFEKRVEGFETGVVFLDEALCEAYDPEHCIKPTDVTTSADSVYTIYTSGTTGTPKGVDVTHGNVTNLLCVEPGKLGMAPGIKVSQMLNISFDFAAWEFLGALVNGATLCLRGKSSKEWKQCLKTVDILFNTPSMLAPHNPADYPNIKTVVVAGEACPKPTADLWGSHFKFWNACGPTEVTIANTMQLHTPGSTVTIGGPTPNNTTYILDADTLRPIPIGQAGVMWAGGASITKGYLNLPDKTQERYVLDPFSAKEGAMMFNTGDLGKWDSTGSLIHLGRIDSQVKIKGFRVELDGVASAMETCPGVAGASALLIEGELWGFVVPGGVDVEEVKKATGKVQPYYAVPTKFLGLDMFPKTSNGKTDKRVLQQMALDSLKTPKVEDTPKPTAPAKTTFVSLPTVTIQPTGTLSVASSQDSLSGTTVAGSHHKSSSDSSSTLAKHEQQFVEAPSGVEKVLRNLFSVLRRGWFGTA